MTGLIDSHRHFTLGKSSASEMLEEMNRDGIEQTVLFGFHGLQFDQPQAQDTQIEQLFTAHPDRIIPYITDIDITRPDFLEYISRCLESGIFKGIGELLFGHEVFHQLYFADIHLDDPAVRELCSLAGEHQVPVLMHVDTPYMQQFEKLLQACPDTRIICPHIAYQFLEIYGGKEADIDYITRLLETFPNLSFDISLWKLSPVYLREEIWLELLERFSGRFLFGTDMTDSYTVQADWLPAYRSILNSLSTEAAANIGKHTIKGIIEAYDY